MDSEQISEVLRTEHAQLADRYGVASLSVFGSATRNEMSEASDVDVLVTFRDGADFDRYFGLKAYLEELLGREVDLVTDKMLKPRLRERIQDDLIRVT